MTQTPPETDGPRQADDPAATASSKSGAPLEVAPAGPAEPTPASAGRERDPADARPHFTTETGTGQDGKDVASSIN